MEPYLDLALRAARAAGHLIRDAFGKPLTVDAEEAHDIKLELDVRTQDLITKMLIEANPSHSVLGEEGYHGRADAEFEWIVDPIDGTVNYFYGIPHFCVSIALRQRADLLVGVIYDPIKDEMWQAEKGGPAYLNEQTINVSPRAQLSEAVVSVGMAKRNDEVTTGLEIFSRLVTQVRKCRMMGSAALDLAYVACGRFDGYIERSVNLWDIAAGWLIVESAGGRMKVGPSPVEEKKLAVVASNSRIDLEGVI